MVQSSSKEYALKRPYVILCEVLSQLRHLHIVQLNHYTIEMILNISVKKIEIMFQTEDAKWRHAKNIFWEYSNRFDLFSNLTRYIMILTLESRKLMSSFIDIRKSVTLINIRTSDVNQIHGILSCEEENCF
jgi:hypothetical protein